MLTCNFSVQQYRERRHSTFPLCGRLRVHVFAVRQYRKWCGSTDAPLRPFASCYFLLFDSIANGVGRQARLCGRLRVAMSGRSTVSETVRVDTRTSAAICELLIPVVRQYRKRCGSTDAPLRPFATPRERIAFSMVIYGCRN